MYPRIWYSLRNTVCNYGRNSTISSTTRSLTTCSRPSPTGCLRIRYSAVFRISLPPAPILNSGNFSPRVTRGRFSSALSLAFRPADGVIHKTGPPGVSDHGRLFIARHPSPAPRKLSKALGRSVQKTASRRRVVQSGWRLLRPGHPSFKSLSFFAT
jgi:hypothetical protein